MRTEFAGEHSYRSVISLKLLFNFIEIALRHGCSPVNLHHLFITSLSKKNSGDLLLYLIDTSHWIATANQLIGFIVRKSALTILSCAIISHN